MVRGRRRRGREARRSGDAGRREGHTNSLYRFRMFTSGQMQTIPNQTKIKRSILRVYKKVSNTVGSPKTVRRASPARPPPPPSRAQAQLNFNIFNMNILLSRKIRQNT